MDSINWDDLYLQLYAFTDNLLKSRSWFRKDQTDSYLKGKQVHDYVQDALEKYLLEPEKYDPSSGRSLVNYLKWHIIRAAVGNDVRSPENKTSSDILSRDGTDSDDESVKNIDALLPFVAAFFGDELDFKNIVKDVVGELQQDEVALIIFKEVRCNNVDRRVVIKQYNLKDSDYDNAMKRLKTVLKRVAKKYQL